MAHDPWMLPHAMMASSLQAMGMMPAPQRPSSPPATALDRYCQRALTAAESRGHQEATLAHLLLGILEAEPGDSAWRGITVDRPALEVAVKRHLQNPSRFKTYAPGAVMPRLSDRVGVVIERATAMAQDAGKTAPELADVFDAMQVYATQTTASAYLRQHGYDRRAMGAALPPVVAQPVDQLADQSELPFEAAVPRPAAQHVLTAQQAAERREPALFEPALRAPALSGPHYRPALGPRYRPTAPVQRTTPPMTTVGLSAAALDVDYMSPAAVSALVSAPVSEPVKAQLTNGLAGLGALDRDGLAAAYAAGRLQARDSAGHLSEAMLAPSTAVVDAREQYRDEERDQRREQRAAGVGAAQKYRFVRRPLAQALAGDIAAPMLATDHAGPDAEVAAETTASTHVERAAPQHTVSETGAANAVAAKTVGDRAWVSTPAIRSVTHAHPVESRMAADEVRPAQRLKPAHSSAIVDRQEIPQLIQRELVRLREMLRSYAEHESKHLRALRKIEDVQTEASFLTKPNAAGHLDNNRQFKGWLEASYQRSNFSLADQRFSELLELLERIDNRLGDEDAGETGSAPQGQPPVGAGSAGFTTMGALSAMLPADTGDALLGVSTARSHDGATSGDPAINGLRLAIRKRRNTRIARLMSRFHDYKPRVFTPWDLRRKSIAVLAAQTPRHSRIKPVAVRVLQQRAEEAAGKPVAAAPAEPITEMRATERSLPLVTPSRTDAPVQRFAERAGGSFAAYDAGAMVGLGTSGTQSWPNVGRDALTASVQRWQAGAVQRSDPRAPSSASVTEASAKTATTVQRATEPTYRSTQAAPAALRSTGSVSGLGTSAATTRDTRMDVRSWTMYPLPEWDPNNR